LRAVYEMAASAINVIIQINRFSDGTRKITAITELTGNMVDGLPEMKDIFIFRQRGINAEGTVLGDFTPTGYIPKIFDDFQTRGIPLSKTVFNP